MKSKNIFLIFCFILLFNNDNDALIKSEDKRNINLTVYNENISLVKEKRYFNFKKGVNKINFDQIPYLIDPNSVFFRSVSSPDKCFLVEQNYEYNIENTSTILESCKGENIQLINESGDIYSGTLLNYDRENIIISENVPFGSLQLLKRGYLKEIRFPDLPKELSLKPSLLWNIFSEEEGNQIIEISYLTKGISWHGEYTAIMDRDDKYIRLACFVSVDNQSGMDFYEANLKLVAGDINLAGRRFETAPLKVQMRNAPFDGKPKFEEESLSDYYLYSLNQPVTLKNKSIKQISLFNPRDVKIEKFYKIDFQKTNGKVAIEIRFRNSTENGINQPLPEGKIRIYKNAKDDSLEFLGEDMIKNIPVDNNVEVKSGFAFDLKAEKKVVSQKKISEKVHDEQVEIVIHNYKDEKVTIEVEEHFYGVWELIESNQRYTIDDAGTVIFLVDAPSDKDEILTYTIRRKF